MVRIEPVTTRGISRLSDDRSDLPTEAKLSFDATVAAYDEIRPAYPAQLFEHLFAMLAPAPHILEVGPGTGQATRDLLSRGATVIAVEISPRMAARLQDNLQQGRLTVGVGDFETFDIAPRSVDAVFSATAYHWISPRAQVDRPAEILRNGGVLAIVDLIQVDSPADRGFFAAAQPIYSRYGQGHKGPPAPLRDAVHPPIARLLSGDQRFEDVQVWSYDWDQTYTAAEYRKLMLSYSTTQMMVEPDRSDLLDDMETFVNSAFGGQVTRPVVVTLTTARLSAL